MPLVVCRHITSLCVYLSMFLVLVKRMQGCSIFFFLPFIVLVLLVHIITRQCFAVRIGLLYLISGFGGSLFSALFIQSNISVGASGALFGLLGGMLSELITNWTIYANKVLIKSNTHDNILCAS